MSDLMEFPLMGSFSLNNDAFINVDKSACYSRGFFYILDKVYKADIVESAGYVSQWGPFVQGVGAKQPYVTWSTMVFRGDERLLFDPRVCESISNEEMAYVNVFCKGVE